MLKLCAVVCVLIVLCIGWTVAEEAAPKQSGYETRYDNVDLDEILKNDRLRKNYIKCLLNEGPCTPDAQELKSNWQSHTNPFKTIHQMILSLKDFLVRLTSRRNSHQLLKMHRETKKWFRKGDTLFH